MLGYKFQHVAELDTEGKDVPVEAKQIIVTGKTTNFTLNEILGDLLAFDKKLKEIEGLRVINAAKVTNTTRQNPFVLDLSEHDRLAVYLYHEAMAMVTQTEKHRDMILAQKAEALKEIEDIKAQIPELKDVPVETEPMPSADTQSQDANTTKEASREAGDTQTAEATGEKTTE